MKKKQIKSIIALMVFLGVVSPSFSTEKPKQVTLNSTKENIPKEVSVWLEKELANSSSQVLESFEVPEFFTSKNAKIIGYIKDYDQNQGAKTGMFYYKNDLTNESKPKVLEIHKDGRFELELPLEYPMYNKIYIDNGWVEFYIEPGQNLSIVLENEIVKGKKKPKVSYQGMLKKINTDLLEYKPKYSYRKLNKMQKKMDAMSFQKEMFKFKKHFEDKIDAHLESGVIDKKTAELLENKIVLRAYEYMFDYFSFSKKRELERKGINMLEMIPKGYYDFINEIPLDKQSILVNDEFASFVNSLEFSPPLRSSTKTFSYTTSSGSLQFFKYLNSKKNDFSEEDKKIIDDLSKTEENELTIDQRKKMKPFIESHQTIFAEYLKSVNKEMKKEREELSKKSDIADWKEKDSLADNLGIKNTIVYDIIKSRNLEYNMLRSDNSDELKKWWWSFMKENIASPHLQKLGDEFLEKSLTMSQVYELPDSEKGTAIFKRLISPYKGKVVIVQYWNPRSYYKGEDLECIKKRRNLFKNNSEVVFLHMTNENFSSLKEYNKSVEENGFENSIRITEDEYNYLLQLFKFRGEVKNVVVNSEGKIVRGYRGTHMLADFLKENFNILPTQK